MKCLVWTAAVYGAETVDADTSGQTKTRCFYNVGKEKNGKDQLGG